MKLAKQVVCALLTAALAVLLLVEFSVVASAAEKTHDFTAQATSTLNAGSAKWTLQLPATATKYARVKAVAIQATGGAGICDFTVYRGATLATTGTVSTPGKVSGKIEGGTVPTAQARFYSGSDSSGGTQLGFPHRLKLDGDRVTVDFDALYLEAGEAVMVSSGTCTATVDVMTVHEEY